MASLVDELFGVVPRLVERTRDQLDLASRVLAHLPCVSRVLGGAIQTDDPQESAGRTDDRAVVVPIRPSVPATVVPDPGDLAIPGYDELAASQVIPRLDGLEPMELEAVRTYESAHRDRRTILARIEQLQAG